MLGLGSPTHPLPAESYDGYCATYQWKEIYGREYLYSGPLFTHQLSHLWIDFRGIRDAFMRERGIDYFENSRQATFVQQEYAVRNPLEFEGYGEHCWGFTACDGPGWIVRTVNGVEAAVLRLRRPRRSVRTRRRHGRALGSGGVAAVRARDRHSDDSQVRTTRPRDDGALRIQADVQSDVCCRGQPDGRWVTPHHFGIDQGPVVLMIENYRTGLIWDIMRRCPPILTGLRRAGFAGGWV